jgi:hypothetical protein
LNFRVFALSGLIYWILLQFQFQCFDSLLILFDSYTVSIWSIFHIFFWIKHIYLIYIMNKCVKYREALIRNPDYLYIKTYYWWKNHVKFSIRAAKIQPKCIIGMIIMGFRWILDGGRSYLYAFIQYLITERRHGIYGWLHCW